MTRPARGGPRLALLAGTGILALLLGELAVRVLLPPPQIVQVAGLAADSARPPSKRPPPAALEADPTEEGEKSLYVMTPTGKRLRPDTVVTVSNHRMSQRDVVIRTNSVGYRNPELGPKACKRILFLGDSITFGNWLEEEETFVRLVEERFRSQGETVETINAGVGAIGLENELAILLETGLATRPDVVVLGFYLNDAQASPGVNVLRAPKLLARSHLVQHLLRAVTDHRPLENDGAEIPDELLETWREQVREEFPPGPGDRLKDAAAFNQVIDNRFLDWGSAWSVDVWRLIEPLLRELARQSEIHDFELRIVAFPVRLQVEAEAVRDFPQRQLARIADDLGVPLLDPLPLLRERHRDQPEALFFDQCHYTPYGNEVVADAIFEFLR